jgi:hypothetical protein
MLAGRDERTRLRFSRISISRCADVVRYSASASGPLSQSVHPVTGYAPRTNVPAAQGLRPGGVGQAAELFRPVLGALGVTRHLPGVSAAREMSARTAGLAPGSPRPSLGRHPWRPRQSPVPVGLNRRAGREGRAPGGPGPSGLCSGPSALPPRPRWAYHVTADLRRVRQLSGVPGHMQCAEKMAMRPEDRDARRVQQKTFTDGATLAELEAHLASLRSVGATGDAHPRVGVNDDCEITWMGCVVERRSPRGHTRRNCMTEVRGQRAGLPCHRLPGPRHYVPWP